jgi:hypothetical protein
MITVIVLTIAMLASAPVYTDIIVPGSCVVIRGGGTPNPDCSCLIYKSSGNLAQDAYNFAHGYTQTAEITGPCVSYDCRDYRADQWEELGCYPQGR